MKALKTQDNLDEDSGMSTPRKNKNRTNEDIIYFN